MVATMSIWYVLLIMLQLPSYQTSRLLLLGLMAQSTKDWEHQFSRKLNTMIGMLSQALKTSEHAGPEQERTDSQKTVEKGAANSIRQNDLTAQIV